MTMLTDVEMESLFYELPVPTQQAIARGEVTMEDVFERITRPGTELCPHCGRYEIPDDLKRVGICRSCFSKRTQEAHQEVMRDLENVKAVNAAKQAAKRAREELELNPRKYRDHLTAVATDLLRAMLRSGPEDTVSLLAAAKLIGIPESVLREAKANEGIESQRIGKQHVWGYPEGLTVPEPRDSAVCDAPLKM